MTPSFWDFNFQAQLFWNPVSGADDLQTLWQHDCLFYILCLHEFPWVLSFPHCLSSISTILFTDLLLYFNLVFLSLSIMAPCSPHCADELNIPFELLPYGAALSYSDAEESNLGFKPSSLGSYTALILLSMCTLARHYACLLCASLPQQTLADLHCKDKMYQMD